jgi:hypothetical protein
LADSPIEAISIADTLQMRLPWHQDAMSKSMELRDYSCGMRRLSVGVLLMVLCLMACAAPPAATPIPQTGKPALIEFYADW